MPAGTSRLKELIAVAKEGSSDKRRDLLREITDVFMAQPEHYTSTKLQHFDIIMSRVTEPVESALRREIAEMSLMCRQPQEALPTSALMMKSPLPNLFCAEARR